MKNAEKNRIRLGKLWKLCPVRHAVLLTSLAWLVVYFTTRGNRVWMERLSKYLVRPWHRIAGGVFSLVPFCVSEWVVAAWILLAIWLLVRLGIHMRLNDSPGTVYKWFVSVLTIASMIFGLFSLWWGVYYYAGTFSETAGLVDRPISSQELERVTAWFADQAEEYALLVERDEEGIFIADRKELFAHSKVLYHAAEELFPSLRGPELRAKPVLFSRLMSYTNTTGFFFPYTAEANINVDCPMAMLPATIGHELAHQRGVAREDEANFVGILACMEDGDPAYAYSGALMAYVYLGNALHDTDYDAWLRIASSFSEPIRRDLEVHNAYWAQFETPVATVSDKVYETFLETYGDDRGMKSYDACVDLLVIYYLDKI